MGDKMKTDKRCLLIKSALEFKCDEIEISLGQ